MTRISSAEESNIAARHADSQLLVALGNGDEHAMSRLFELYSQLVYSVSFRVLKDSAAAEDVMQEVFLQIWRSPTTFTAARGSLAGFLAVMARNRSIDVLRKRRPTDPIEDLPLASPDNVAETSERNLMIERVREAMKGLPPEQSTALEMAFFSGWTHSEIAEMTGSPLGTVKTRVRGALHVIQKALRA